MQQINYHPLGAVDDPMNCCPRPSASGNSSSGHPQHLGGYNFDCWPERYEIVVLCVKSDVRFLILGEIFLLLEGRKSIFLSASRSQFVAIGPATIMKIGQRITFLWPK